MGRITLQMMISADGMASGPNGELDWTGGDNATESDHLERLERASLVMVGAGVIPEMSEFWTTIEHDEEADPIIRHIGSSINAIPKIVYSDKAMQVDWRGATVQVVKDTQALVKDVRRVKQEIDGTIIIYGGVRLARTFIQEDLVDEIHLDVCPVILGKGKPLFTELKHRTNLRLLEAVPYDSGITMLRYEVVRK